MAELSAEKTYIFEKMPVFKAVMKLAVPSVLSQLVTLIYNMADTFFVGKTGDKYQVAAVSMVYTVFFVLSALGSLYGIGGGSLIARLLGAKRPDRVKRASAFSLYAGIATTAVVSLVILAVMRPMLNLLGASENTYGFCRDYTIWVVVIGGVPTVAALIMGNLLRSEGYSRQAGFGVALGGILNIVLDPIFIFTFNMGVKGAAIATMISNVASVVFYLFVYRSLKGKTLVSLSPRDFGFDRDIVGQVYIIGLPAFISTMFSTAANTVCFNMLSKYGDLQVAAFGVTKKLDIIPMCMCMGVGNGVLPLIAYNYASGSIKRMKEALRVTLGMGLLLSAVYLAAGRLFSESLVRFFIDDAETIACGGVFIRIECLAAPLMVINNLMNSAFQAMGKGVQSLIFSASRSAVLKIPMTIIMNTAVGLNGIIWSQFVTDLIMLAVTFGLFAGMMKALQRSKTQLTQ